MRTSLKLGLSCGSALGVVLGLSAIASPAMAQATQPATDDPVVTTSDDATTVDEVVVVGSRIRRDTYNTPAPIQVITREETTLAGFDSATEALQSTAVTGGSGQINNAYGGFVTNGGPGANTIGLRGLGPARTLVLLNGRRVSPAGSRGGVGSADLNVLPSAMIERIEILRDGASSIYGSDAVAGVINVQTRRNVDDVTLEAQFSRPFEEGGEEARISMVAGRGFLDDRLHLTGSLEWYKREDLTLADRDWTQCNQDYRFNKATGVRTDYIDPVTGRPKCYPITGTGSNGVTINTIGTSNISGIGAPGSVAPGTVSTFNRWRPNSAITSGLIGFEGVGGGSNNINVRDTFDPRTLNRSLISPVEIYTAFGQATYDVQALGNAEFYAELLVNRRNSEQTGYRQLSLDYRKGSPLIPANLQASTFSGPSPITPGANVGVRAFIGFGNDHSSQEVDFIRGTAGLRGDLFLNDWRYDFTVSAARSDSSYTQESWLTDRMAQSLDVVAAPGGGFVCRNPANGCVAAPALTSAVIGGVLPQDWVDWTFVPVTGNTLYTEETATLNIDGPLFELPAGAIQSAFGIEYRTAEIDDTPSIHSQNGNLYNLTSSAITRGTDSVWEIYGEVEVPVLKDLAFAQDLTVNASARYTEYDSYGGDTTYKLGAVYSPIEAVTFRATYGTSFRAPALFEQFQGATSGFLSNQGDPCNNYGAAGVDPVVKANCAAEGLSPNFQATSSIAVITAGGAAQGLEAETSENFTAGIILQPTLPEGWGNLAFAVDYYDIKIENGVQRLGAANLLSLCYTDPNFRSAGGLGYCRYVDARDPVSNQLTVRDSYTNVATVVVEGIDWNLRYTRDLGPGSVRINAALTQYLEQSSRLFSDQPMNDVNGTITAPEFTGNVDVTYTMDAWRFRYGMEWIDGMSDYEYLKKQNPAYNPQADDRILEVDDYFLHHLSVQYTADAWTATVGVRNVFDEEPPMISSGRYNLIGNAPLYSNYDYVGRTAFVNISKRF